MITQGSRSEWQIWCILSRWQCRKDARLRKRLLVDFIKKERESMKQSGEGTCWDGLSDWQRAAIMSAE